MKSPTVRKLTVLSITMRDLYLYMHGQPLFYDLQMKTSNHAENSVQKVP